MKSISLLTPLNQILARRPHVVIVGSGPAGVAVAEYLYNVFPDVTIAILERGDILTLTHVNNLFPDDEVRGAFIDAHGTWPWKGYFKGNGMMMFALGGRGIVAGGHLRRFDACDFDLWKNGRWPIKLSELERFFTVAEIVRNVSPGECVSRAQNWVMGALDVFNPHPPPWGIDIRATGSRRALDSSVQRLCELIHRDCLEAHRMQKERRLLVSVNTQVKRITVSGGRVTNLVCQNSAELKVVKRFGTVVLAASPVESARLILESKLDRTLGLKVAGKYLAEHILSRTEVTVSFPIDDPTEARVNVVIPPPGRNFHQRFQIDVRQSVVPVRRGKLHLRISGFAAMDPSPENVMELDGINVNTVMKLSTADDYRVEQMQKTMVAVAKHLGARKIPPPKVTKGRSNHEVGTLRMGKSKSDSVTDATGKVHSVENLYVADASVFPCVGVANPMLTITALAYRLAQNVGRNMRLKEKGNLKAPWSLC